MALEKGFIEEPQTENLNLSRILNGCFEEGYSDGEDNVSDGLVDQTDKGKEKAKEIAEEPKKVERGKDLMGGTAVQVSQQVSEEGRLRSFLEDAERFWRRGGRMDLKKAISALEKPDNKGESSQAMEVEMTIGQTGEQTYQPRASLYAELLKLAVSEQEELWEF